MDNQFRHFSGFTPYRFSGRANQLNDFVNHRHLALLDAGDAQRDELDTVEKVEAHAARMKETFLEKLGGIPERDCPLDPVTTKIIEKERFTMESVVFKARKGAYVTGTWYFPKHLQGPSAAVLFMCGHSTCSAPRICFGRSCISATCPSTATATRAPTASWQAT